VARPAGVRHGSSGLFLVRLLEFPELAALISVGCTSTRGHGILRMVWRRVPLTCGTSRRPPHSPLVSEFHEHASLGCSRKGGHRCSLRSSAACPLGRLGLMLPPSSIQNALKPTADGLADVWIRVRRIFLAQQVVANSLPESPAVVKVRRFSR
jgi:hypothetical protein